MVAFVDVEDAFTNVVLSATQDLPSDKIYYTYILYYGELNIKTNEYDLLDAGEPNWVRCFSPS